MLSTDHFFCSAHQSLRKRLERTLVRPAGQNTWRYSVKDCGQKYLRIRPHDKQPCDSFQPSSPWGVVRSGGAARLKKPHSPIQGLCSGCSGQPARDFLMIFKGASSGDKIVLTRILLNITAPQLPFRDVSSPIMQANQPLCTWLDHRCPPMWRGRGWTGK